MTADPLYVAAYWGPRGEGVERCAERTAECLRGLAAVSPLLGSWREKGGSRAAAAAQATVDFDGLADLLRRGAQRRDTGGAPMPELGFRAALWNGGGSGAAATFSITCGSTVHAVPNTCIVGLPKPGPEADDLYRRPAVDGVLRSLIEAWSPDWAVATSHKLRNATAADAGSGSGAAGPAPGWLTYVSQADSVPDDLDGVSATSVPAGGAVFAVADEWSEVAADRVMAARRTLARLGLIG